MPVKPTPFRVPIRDPNPGHGQNFPHNVPGFVSWASSEHVFWWTLPAPLTLALLVEYQILTHVLVNDHRVQVPVSFDENTRKASNNSSFVTRFVSYFWFISEGG